MNVGILAYRYDYYPYVRNMVGIVPGVRYLRVKDLYSRVNAGVHLINRLTHREFIRTFDLNNQFYDFNLNQVDLLHFFNGISYGRTPWLSTFETVLPRFRNVVQFSRQSPAGMENNRKITRAFEALAGPSCKRIIAISHCAATMEGALLGPFNAYKEVISQKLLVMHPPQDLLVMKYEDKQVGLDGQIMFMLVGDAFYRKGGREILETLKTLRDRHHYDIGLTIVSSLRTEDYAVHSGPELVRQTKAFIDANSDWVKYYSHLPNIQVLELMKKGHVGLLPTYADSYGYSVLEFQAAGCPVITTDVRALPEINDAAKGWLIEVPKNSLGEAIYETEHDRLIISEAIRIGLEKAVHEIFSQPSIIPQKSASSILNIERNHSRTEFANRMKNVYLEALSQRF